MAAYAMRLRRGSGEYRFACIEDIGFGAMPRGVQAPPGRLFNWRGDDSSVSPTKRAGLPGMPMDRLLFHKGAACAHLSEGRQGHDWLKCSAREG